MQHAPVTLNPLNHPTCMCACSRRRPPSYLRAALGKSYVPEYVRRPRDFVCYALDQPIVVGSGDDGTSALEAAAAQAQAQVAAGGALRMERDGSESARLGGAVASSGDAAAAEPCLGGTVDLETASVPDSVDFVPRSRAAAEAAPQTGAGVAPPVPAARQQGGSRAGAGHTSSLQEEAGEEDAAAQAGTEVPVLAQPTGRLRRRFRVRVEDEDT